VIALTSREYQILHTLMVRPGAIISRREIEEQLYNVEADVDSNAVEVHVHKLRQKLDAGVIRTVRGLGYQLVEL
jgi:two-component system response regulator QseB